MENLSSLHGLVILLAFSHLIYFSHAVPSTRAQRMMEETGNHGGLVTETAQITDEDALEYFRNERMDLEINDYPGSGANDHHTPKPPENPSGDIIDRMSGHSDRVGGVFRPGEEGGGRVGGVIGFDEEDGSNIGGIYRSGAKGGSNIDSIYL